MAITATDLNRSIEQLRAKLERQEAAVAATKALIDYLVESGHQKTTK